MILFFLISFVIVIASFMIKMHKCLWPMIYLFYFCNQVSPLLEFYFCLVIYFTKVHRFLMGFSLWIILFSVSLLSILVLICWFCCQESCGQSSWFDLESHNEWRLRPWQLHIEDFGTSKTVVYWWVPLWATQVKETSWEKVMGATDGKWVENFWKLCHCVVSLYDVAEGSKWENVKGSLMGSMLKNPRSCLFVEDAIWG